MNGKVITRYAMTGLLMLTILATIPLASAVVYTTFQATDGETNFVFLVIGRRDAGEISGKWDTGECGLWPITGTYVGRHFQITALNPQRNNGCPEWVVFAGWIRSETEASGTFYDADGNSGSFHWWLGWTP